MGNRPRAYSLDRKVSSKKVIRAAVYARYSSQMQKADSIDDQIRNIRRTLKNKTISSTQWPDGEIKILGEWIITDEAKSGKTSARDGYQQILMGMQAGEFDLLLVDHLSRVTRDLGGMVEIYDASQFSNVEIISVTEKVSSADPMAKTWFRFKGIINEMENDGRADCTRRSMRSKYEQGFTCGDVPFGYKTKATAQNTSKGQNKPCNFKPEIDRSEAKIVRRIFEMYTKGVGRASICKTLNEEGVAWPSFKKGKGSGWSQTTVSSILQNEKYNGVWRWGIGKEYIEASTGKRKWRQRPKDEWVFLNTKRTNEDLIIIEEELWLKVQSMLKALDKIRSSAKSKKQKIFARNSEHPSTNLLCGHLKCARCGGNMIMVSGKYGGYYGCYEAHRKSACDNRSMIRRTWIEEKVVGEIEKKLKDTEYVEYITQQYNRQKHNQLSNTRHREQDLSEELQGLKVEVNRLVEFITKGEGSDTIAKALKVREDRIQEIEHLLAHANASGSNKVFVLSRAISQRLSKLLEMFQKDRSTARKIIGALLAERISIESRKDIETLEIKINALSLLKPDAISV